MATAAEVAPVTKITNCTHWSVPLPKGDIKGAPGATVKVVTAAAVPAVIDGASATVEFEAPQDGVVSPSTNVKVDSGTGVTAATVTLVDVGAIAGKQTPAATTLKLDKTVDVSVILNSTGTYSTGGKVKFKVCVNESTVPDAPAPGTTLCTTLAITVPAAEITGVKGTAVKVISAAPVPAQLQGKDMTVSFISSKTAPALPGTGIKVDSTSGTVTKSVTIADAAAGLGTTIVVTDLLQLQKTVDVSVVLGDAGTYSGGGRVKLSNCTKAPKPGDTTGSTTTTMAMGSSTTTTAAPATTVAPSAVTTTTIKRAASTTTTTVAPSTTVTTTKVDASQVVNDASGTAADESSDQLARTGVNTFTMTMIASALVLAGMAMASLGRRLRRMVRVG